MLKGKKVAELRALADEFGVEYADIKTKSALLARLEEEGVTDEVVSDFEEAVKEEPKVDKVDLRGTLPATPAPEDFVLIYMKRANPTYEVLGYTFTKANPFIAMKASDAEELISLDERGFRRAEPKEVQEYYS